MRLIDGDALKEKLPNTYHNVFENCRECRLLEREEVNAYIDRMPTVDAVPVKHGRWKPSPYLEGMFKCSACGDEWGAAAKLIPMMYCPGCGAKMDLEEQDETDRP